jgi:hypothetical protein
MGARVWWVYTAFSHSINPVVIHDPPIYFDSGKFLFIVTWIFTRWWTSRSYREYSSPGITRYHFSSFAASIAIFIGSFFNAAGNDEVLAFVVLIMFYSFMSLVVMIMPLTALFLWTAGRLRHVHGLDWRIWRNWGLLLGPTVLGGLFGSLSLFSRESRQMLYRMDELIKRV